MQRARSASGRTRVATRPGLALRALRSLVLAAVTVAVGAGGHMLGNGFALPPVTVLLATGGLIAGIGVLLGGREWGARSIVAALVLGQVGVHLGASLSMAGGGMGGSTLPSGITLLCHPGAAASAVAGTRGGGTGSLALMVTGHAVSAWWLRRGEAAAWRKLRAAARAVGRALGLGRSPLPAPALPLSVARPRTSLRVVALQSPPGRGRSRRGPPLFAALA